MKLTKHFDSFLADTVNLNKSRLDSLESASSALDNFIKSSDWGAERIEWFPQGSWSHKTIIKPVDQGEYDADILIMVKPVADWSAADYIENLYSAFKSSSRYKDSVRRWSHCVTITYANERKIDIAPCVVDRAGISGLEVCNRNSDQFERTEARKYTDWLIEKNGISGSNSFRKVTRLVKYLRDIKGTFTCSSVCLTTLLAHQIREEDRGSIDFSDTPTALRTIFSRLDDYLKIRPGKPEVRSPFSSEDFASSWTQGQYDNFRNFISKYRGWIDDAYNEENRNASIRAWRKVFGDAFAEDVDADAASSAYSFAVATINKHISYAANTFEDAVDLIKKFGRIAIPVELVDLPYMKQPTWVTSKGRATIQIHAQTYSRRNGSPILELASGSISPKGQSVLFTPKIDGMAISSASAGKVLWRITNTGREALQRKQLRGGFDSANDGSKRWETLSYRGMHIVEAFLLDATGNIEIARSDQFFVVIE